MPALPDFAGPDREPRALLVEDILRLLVPAFIMLLSTLPGIVCRRSALSFPAPVEVACEESVTRPADKGNR